MDLNLSRGGRRRVLTRRGISRAVFRTETFKPKSDLRRPGAEWGGAGAWLQTGSVELSRVKMLAWTTVPARLYKLTNLL